MVPFVCDGCGKCCTSLGAYIKIERQLTEQDFFCKNGITGEIFPVHVQPEFAEVVDERFTNGHADTTGSPRPGCVFLCRNPAGPGFVCAIYPTRPQVCREFRCCHMMIHNSKGAVVGRMVGNRDIQTADPILARIWSREVKSLPVPGKTASGPESPYSDPVWIQKANAILSSHGYRGEPVQ
ncbi:MAG: YkgJ family cysteine cluster protein [Methanoregula sp.]|nr:YkgJ family cysteine cluster protein [Methanoregula sp.]